MKSRLAASIALAAALMLGTTGCTFMSPIATQKSYDPSDGVGTDVGQLSIRNALLIGEDAETLNLVMTVTSSADVARRLHVQWVSNGERVSEAIVVPANGRTSIGGPDQEGILVVGSGARLGGLVPIFFTYGNEQGSQVLVPVLDGGLPEYELYIP